MPRCMQKQKHHILACMPILLPPPKRNYLCMHYHILRPIPVSAFQHASLSAGCNPLFCLSHSVCGISLDYSAPDIGPAQIRDYCTISSLPIYAPVSPILIVWAPVGSSHIIWARMGPLLTV